MRFSRFNIVALSLTALLYTNLCTAMLLGSSPLFDNHVLSLTTSNTSIHQPGYCAMRGHCGKAGFFDDSSPCVYNGPASPIQSSADLHRLSSLCGSSWKNFDTLCCSPEQINDLVRNLRRAEQIIGSCPACKTNFFNLFCSLTCSPHQSLFLNVTQFTPVKDSSSIPSFSPQSRVTQLDYFLSEKFADIFYNSCKDVKFGPGLRAIKFIGADAKSPSELLKYLGSRRIGGSPFQINFHTSSDSLPSVMKPMNDTPYACDDLDDNYRCSCIDCPASCPAQSLAFLSKSCHVGALPCLSFAAVLFYSTFLFLLTLAVLGHVYYQKYRKPFIQRTTPPQVVSFYYDFQSESEVNLNTDNETEDGEIGPNHFGDGSEPQLSSYGINSICFRIFSQLGLFCAKYYVTNIILCLALCFFLSLGCLRFAIERDPIKLWVSPNSPAALQKEYFDTHFGPFYRIEQAFLVNDTQSLDSGTVLSYDNLKWWFGVEKRLSQIAVPKEDSLETIKLSDVCFNPINNVCVVQSITGYFHSSIDNLDADNWKSQIEYCTELPINCLPDFQQPIEPSMILGGMTADSPLSSRTLISTWIIKNFNEESHQLSEVKKWENEVRVFFQSIQQEAQDRGLRLSFSTDISLEQELNKSTNTDIKIIILSYLAMLIYASFALGSSVFSWKLFFKAPMRTLLGSNFLLGLSGILIVMLSISTTVGLFSLMGLRVTLIIGEVLPFLILAVGVDNIFLIVHEFDRVNFAYARFSSLPVRIAQTMGRVGPSILLSGTIETTIFALGALVEMPAVRNFASYAAVAVLINAALQVTLFVSVLTVNQRMIDHHKSALYSRMPGSVVDTLSDYDYDYDYEVSSDGVLRKRTDDMISRFIRNKFTPLLLGKKVKAAILVIFLGLFSLEITLLPQIQLGLDQRIAIPQDSYLIPYFNDVYDYLDTGPPVYFVVKGTNVTERLHQQELCGKFLTCNSNSLTNVLEKERKNSDTSYISGVTASWIDDFLLWLNPSYEFCCRENGDTCFAHRIPPYNRTLWGMPEGKEFIHYAKLWLNSPTTIDCPLAGKAGYSSAVVINEKELTIEASHFRTSHRPLRSQSDFIDAYAASKAVSQKIEQGLDGGDVFAYSPFYVFFDQYTSIVSTGFKILTLGLMGILIMSRVLLGSMRTGLIVTIVLIMIMVNMLAIMPVIGIDLNGVSLVNLVICLGLGVEFCAHVARAFSFPPNRRENGQDHLRFTAYRASGNIGTNATQVNVLSNGIAENEGITDLTSRNSRANVALAWLGGSVLRGITATKLVGLSVLAFARSKVFVVYYFRMWLALIFVASIHALVVLPLLLSTFGGNGYLDASFDNSMENHLRSRMYPALLPDEEDEEDDEEGEF